jgi:lipid A 3-O-deacylase
MKQFILTSTLVALLVTSANAGQQITSGKSVVTTTSSGPFERGRFELQSASGGHFSFGDSSKPSLDYSSTTYRLGIMLDSPMGDGLMRGNNELFLQFTYGGVFHGAGNGMGIAAVLWRYNFVQPDSRWVPFVQVGAGAMYNDIFDDRPVTPVDHQWELNLEAAIGVRYFLSERWSMNVEADYRHSGFHSVGASVGLGRHF